MKTCFRYILANLLELRIWQLSFTKYSDPIIQYFVEAPLAAVKAPGLLG